MDIAAGRHHTCALDEAGELLCWGDYQEWVHATDTPQGPFVDVEAGYDVTCAIREDSTVMCWGAWALGLRP